MKKSILLLLMGGLALCLTPDLHAQNYGTGKKKKKKAEPREQTRTERDVRTDDYFDDGGNFKSKLWYGGSGVFVLNQATFQGQSYGIFAIGVRPQVGYKITPAFSLGPTVGIAYRSQREAGIGFNAIQYGVGAFSRYRIIPAIFAHAEYYIDRVPIATGFQPDNPSRLTTEHVTFNDFLVGLGYQSNNGSAWGQTIEVLYNVSNPPQNTLFPFELRVGINYNF